jgi:hypothetical protein
MPCGITAGTAGGFAMIHLSIRILAGPIHKGVEKLVDNCVDNSHKSVIVSALYRFA